MSNSNQNKLTKYSVRYGFVSNFFVPHASANNLNAQDVVGTLLEQAKAITSIAWHPFEDDENGKIVNTTSDEIMSTLLWDVLIKLELIEKILPMVEGRLTAQEVVADQDKKMGVSSHD